MAWDYFFPNHQRPSLINHIEDRDLWLFKLMGTREVMASVFSYPQDFYVWDELFRVDIKRLRVDGAAIERKHRKDVTELVTATKRRMVIGGFDVPVVNLPHTFASDAGALLSSGEAFAACYWDTPDGRSFSLRSTDAGEDVSAIAKRYGGGGHRNASGFLVPFDHVLASPVQLPVVGGETEIQRYQCRASEHHLIGVAVEKNESGRFVLFDDVAPLLAEIKRLKGLQPAGPPRPPEGSGLPRYGLRWNGPHQPVSVPMDDGYWTPWHLAVQLGGSHG